VGDAEAPALAPRLALDPVGPLICVWVRFIAQLCPGRIASSSSRKQNNES